MLPVVDRFLNIEYDIGIRSYDRVPVRCDYCVKLVPNPWSWEFEDLKLLRQHSDLEDKYHNF